jgi:hypothetical protein
MHSPPETVTSRGAPRTQEKLGNWLLRRVAGLVKGHAERRRRATLCRRGPSISYMEGPRLILYVHSAPPQRPVLVSTRHTNNPLKIPPRLPRRRAPAVAPPPSRPCSPRPARRLGLPRGWVQIGGVAQDCGGFWLLLRPKSATIMCPPPLLGVALREWSSSWNRRRALGGLATTPGHYVYLPSLCRFCSPRPRPLSRMNADLLPTGGQQIGIDHRTDELRARATSGKRCLKVVVGLVGPRWPGGGAGDPAAGNSRAAGGVMATRRVEWWPRDQVR